VIGTNSSPEASDIQELTVYSNWCKPHIFISASSNLPENQPVTSPPLRRQPPPEPTDIIPIHSPTIHQSSIKHPSTIRPHPSTIRPPSVHYQSIVVLSDGRHRNERPPRSTRNRAHQFAHSAQRCAIATLARQTARTALHERAFAP
jgi:hypothetical protein